MVDLGGVATIDKVTIHNRIEECCDSRLQQFYVTLLTDDGGDFSNTVSVVSQYFPEFPLPATSLDIDFESVSAQYVRVRYHDDYKSWLDLAEVQVYGTFDDVRT
jgi:hypothetical protein